MTYFYNKFKYTGHEYLEYTILRYGCFSICIIIGIFAYSYSSILYKYGFIYNILFGSFTLITITINTYIFLIYLFIFISYKN